MSEDKVEEGRTASIRDSVSAFFTELNAEFHRISWPKGKELVETTLVVLAFIVGLSVTVLAFDKVIEFVLRSMLGA
jgi:preprotein translocase SecE subunit